MAFITAAMLFIRDLNGIAFDTLISEQHQSGQSMTQYPVESGAPITDHSYPTPKVLTLTVGPFRTRQLL